MGDSGAADMAEPPRKKLRNAIDHGPELSLQTITVRVGKTKCVEEFCIHESLLRSNSIFFDNCLKECWKEHDERVVPLPDANRSAFKIWTKWLYTRRLFVTPEQEDKIPVEKIDNRHALTTKILTELKHLWHCYRLGTFLADIDFKDAIIDAHSDLMVSTGKYHSTLYMSIYASSARSSRHRQLAVEVFVHLKQRVDFAAFQDLSADLRKDDTVEFMGDLLAYLGPQLAKGIRQQSPAEFFRSEDTCRYHEHGKDGICYKKIPALNW